MSKIGRKPIALGGTKVEVKGQAVHYSGGKASTANYRAVSSGSTQHAEFVKVIYDPEVIDYKTLLMIF